MGEFTPWGEIVDDHHTSFGPPKIDDELARSQGCCTLGFDYSTATGPEREYVFSIVRWVALKIGRRRRQFKGLILDDPVAYWCPEGTTPQPVLVLDEWSGVSPDVPVYSLLGVPVSYKTIRELAWYHIPDGAHERISATHYGHPSQEVKEALIEAGWDGAKETLRIIEAHIARLEAFWSEP